MITLVRPAPFRSVRQFFFIWQMQARQAWYHKMAAGAVVLSWGLRLVLTMILYYGIYQALGGGQVKGLSFSVATSSMVFYAMMTVLGTRDIARRINHEYRYGMIEIWLNKPVSYVVLKIAEVTGNAVPAFAAITVCGLLYWLAGGLPVVDRMPERVIAAVILFAGGAVIAACLYALVGLSVIWLKNSDGVFLIVDKIIMIFGGAYIPIAFFPDTLRLVGELLPTGAIMYVAQTFYPDYLQNLPRFLLCQLFWIVVLVLALYRLCHVMNRHMQVNGG